jgi:hypothetical protein
MKALPRKTNRQSAEGRGDDLDSRQMTEHRVERMTTLRRTARRSSSSLRGTRAGSNGSASSTISPISAKSTSNRTAAGPDCAPLPARPSTRSAIRARQQLTVVLGEWRVLKAAPAAVSRRRLTFGRAFVTITRLGKHEEDDSSQRCFNLR